MDNLINGRHIVFGEVYTAKVEIPSDAKIHQLIVNYEGKGTIDIGALCYANRDKSRRHRSYTVTRVEQSSYSESRAKLIKKIFNKSFSEIITRKLKSSSAYVLAMTLREFFEWTDQSSSPPLDRKEDVLAAFRAYAEHLWEIARLGLRSTETTSKTTRVLSSFLSRVFNDLEFKSGFRQHKKGQRSERAAIVLSEDDFRRPLSLSWMFFDGLCDFVLNFKKYPYKIPMPSYLGWQNPFLYIAPVAHCYRAPHLRVVDGLYANPASFDFSSGEILTYEQARRRYPSTTVNTSVRSAIRNLTEQIKQANKDYQSTSRRQLAIFAQANFMFLFAAGTATHVSQMADLPWSNEYSIEDVEEQGFRVVKYRAGNKEITIRMRARLLKLFERYLELRKYLLNGRDWDKLFMSFDQLSKSSTFTKVHKGVLYGHYKKLKETIDPTLPKVRPSDLRLMKSDFLLRLTNDVSATAVILQNSEKTVQKHYAHGSPVTAAKEMTQLFTSLKDVIKDAQNSLRPEPQENNTVASGNCKQYEKPNPVVVVHAEITPDCKKYEGCLFCDKFFVHADETDVRKLLSHKYCIQKKRHLSASEEHFNELHGPVITRIDYLINAISGRSDECRKVVETVSTEVFEYGKLDSFWKNKLSLLVELGLVS